MPRGVWVRTGAHRNKYREVALAKEYGSWLRGKALSEVTKQKLSISNLGKDRTHGTK